jgi:carbon-monoxide dehydrogenase medium subunit
MYQFTYHRPENLAQALDMFGASTDAKLLAGGHTLIPTMKQRLAAPAEIIDLNAIPGLNEISIEGNQVVIGALARHVTVANSPLVQKAIPALAELASLIGDPAVRHRGTIGGSIANNDPAADYPAASLALGATIVTDRREIVAEEFFIGLFETALEEGEIVTQIRFPTVDKSAWQKFRNPASRYAIVGVFLAKAGNDVRVAVTGSGAEGVFRETQFEEALAADFQPEAIRDLLVDEDKLNADIHADRPYRAHLINVLTRRAVASVL